MGIPTAYEIACREHEMQIKRNENLKYGLVPDDPDGFFVLSMGDGTAKLMPGPEFNQFLFRGQIECHRPCLSSIFRGEPSQIDLFIKWMKILQFKEVLLLHPAISEFQKTKLLGNCLLVSFEGLAQHYHLDTELMDFTSCPWVAAFFASTRYDEIAHKYYPVNKEGQNGVFYRLALNKMRGFSPKSVDIIGAQPLRRPTVQRAFSFRVKYGEDLHKKIGMEYQLFRHDYKTAQKIYEKFEGGDALYSFCPVAKKAAAVSDQKIFSSSILDATSSIYGWDKDTRDNLMTELESRGIRVFTNIEPYSFSKSELVKMRCEWEEIKQSLERKIFIRPVLELVK